MGWTTPQVCRADNRAKHAARSACSVGARLVLHMTKRACATRHVTRKRRYDSLKPQPPTKRGVGGAKEPRPTAWGGARCELAAQATASSPQRAVRPLWAVGWFSTGLSAHAPRATGLKSDGYDDPKPQPPTGRGFDARSLGQRRGVEHVASWPRRQPRQTRSAQCVLCGWTAGSPRNEARARHAPRD